MCLPSREPSSFFMQPAKQHFPRLFTPQMYRKNFVESQVPINLLKPCRPLAYGIQLNSACPRQYRYFKAVLQISPVFSAASAILIFRSVSDVPRSFHYSHPTRPTPSAFLHPVLCQKHRQHEYKGNCCFAYTDSSRHTRGETN